MFNAFTVGLEVAIGVFMTDDFYNATDFPRIVLLNLSASGLKGGLDPGLANLTLMHTLNLLIFSLMKLLTVLADSSTAPSKGKQLVIVIKSTGNPASLCDKNSCKNKNDNKIIVPVIAAVASLFVILSALAIIWVIKRQRERGTGLEIRKKQYTYSEVQSITDNFNVVLGKGGFGTVYQGYIGPFTKDTSSSILNWEERLQIGCDAAHGLEYLHHGCKPPIVHRDIKCTNILLYETFQAKLADFGLSRAFPTESGTHISTAVAGTPGYLDPE
ncbi:leucine-rich repeat transmembrane protein kinase protein [Tanacetum coccineum]